MAQGRRAVALLTGLVFLAGIGVIAALALREDPWGGARQVRIPSSHDDTAQPAMLYVPPGAEPGGTPAPLLVALHSWGGGYDQAQGARFLAECRARGLALIHPHFRGPNRGPAACASEAAVADVLDALAFARAQAEVDPARVYLAGGSGGGHMALTLAARAPWAWSAVSAWVPITDLTRWHEESRARGTHHAREIEAVCGGDPAAGPAAEACRRRSPLFTLEAAAGLPVDLNAGVRDGHEGPVPVGHTLRAWDALARANGHAEQAFGEHLIEQIEAQPRVPEALTREDGPTLATGKVLLERRAGPARLRLLDAGHVLDEAAALDWLTAQRRATRAAPHR